jgi:hypothetical protein
VVLEYLWRVFVDAERSTDDAGVLLNDAEIRSHVNDPALAVSRRVLLGKREPG